MADSYQQLSAEPPVAGGGPAFCPQCGQTYTAGAQFCAGCGFRVTTAQATLVAPASQVAYGQPAMAGVVVQQPHGTVVVTEFVEPRPQVDHCAHCLCCFLWGGLWAPLWLAACADMCCQYPCGQPGCT